MLRRFQNHIFGSGDNSRNLGGAQFRFGELFEKLRNIYFHVGGIYLLHRNVGLREGGYF
jgi:hypothetical protein